jgi:hypothetical protein
MKNERSVPESWPDRVSGANARTTRRQMSVYFTDNHYVGAEPDLLSASNPT